MSAVATVFRITRIVSIVRDKFRFIDVCREYECTAKQIIVFFYIQKTKRVQCIMTVVLTDCRD